MSIGWRLLGAGRGLAYDASGGAPLLCGLLAGMVGMLAYAMVGFPLNQPASGLLFWLALGSIIVLDIYGLSRTMESSTRRPIRSTVENKDGAGRPEDSHHLVDKHSVTGLEVQGDHRLLIFPGETASDSFGGDSSGRSSGSQEGAGDAPLGYGTCPWRAFP